MKPVEKHCTVNPGILWFYTTGKLFISMHVKQLSLAAFLVNSSGSLMLPVTFAHAQIITHSLSFSSLSHKLIIVMCGNKQYCSITIKHLLCRVLTQHFTVVMLKFSISTKPCSTWTFHKLNFANIIICKAFLSKLNKAQWIYVLSICELQHDLSKFAY